jgi:hypothetical protein
VLVIKLGCTYQLTANGVKSLALANLNLKPKNNIMYKALLHILYEEFLANGGTFNSMESDVRFKQAFWKETDVSNRQVFERLMFIPNDEDN